MLQVIYQSALRLAITPQLVSAQIRAHLGDVENCFARPWPSNPRDIPGFDGGITDEGLAYLRTMPNPLWFWRAIELVLNYRELGDRRVISKFELQYAVYAYGKEIEQRYEIDGLPEEMLVSTACQLIRSGYLLFTEETLDGSPVVINPLFTRDFSLH